MTVGSDVADLLARLAELDARELPAFCDGCFMHCAKTGNRKRPYPCPEPLRRWARRHEWSAVGAYEEAL